MSSTREIQELLSQIPADEMSQMLALVLVNTFRDQVARVALLAVPREWKREMIDTARSSLAFHLRELLEPLPDLDAGEQLAEEYNQAEQLAGEQLGEDQPGAEEDSHEEA